MRALAEANLRCPQDVALIGFDDIPAASQTSPTLTTVMQDLKGAGEPPVDALPRRISGADAERTMLTATLTKRQRTAVYRTSQVVYGGNLSAQKTDGLGSSVE